MTNNPVLMIFSLSASLESKTKNVFGKRGRAISTHLLSHLIEGVEKLVKDLTIPVVWYDEDKQVGHSFGERYANAHQELFDKGYNQVVSIGNDCPQLTCSIIEKAVESLSSSKVVVGPSNDGGVYLLGINKTVFDKSLFQNLPWQTDSLFQSLDNCFSGSFIEPILLPHLFDIDDLVSLKKVAAALASKSLNYFLATYYSLFSSTAVWIKNKIYYFFFSYFCHSLRGPPGQVS